MTSLSTNAQAIIARMAALARAEHRLIDALLASDDTWELTAAEQCETPDEPVLHIRDLARRTSADRHALFASAEWIERYRKETEIHVYIVGCEGTARLARHLGQPLFKVGTARIGELAARIAALGHNRYASMVRSPTGYQRENGFARWSPPPRLQLGAPLPCGPVRVATSSFVVDLPVGLTHGRFEAELNRRLRPIGLHHYVDSDAGRAHCASCGLDPAGFIRFGPRSDARGGVACAGEIMRIRPQADGPALAAVLEDIVIDAVVPAAPACRLVA